MLESEARRTARQIVAAEARAGHRPLAALLSRIDDELAGDQPGVTACAVFIAAAAVTVDDDASDESAQAVLAVATSALRQLEADLPPAAVQAAYADLTLARAARHAVAGRQAQASAMAAAALDLGWTPLEASDDESWLWSCTLANSLLATGKRLAALRFVYFTPMMWQDASRCRAACVCLRMNGRGEQIPAAHAGEWERHLTTALALRSTVRLLELTVPGSPERSPEHLLQIAVIARALGNAAVLAKMPKVDSIRRASPDGIARSGPLHALYEVVRWLEGLESAGPGKFEVMEHVDRADAILARMPDAELTMLARVAGARTVAKYIGAATAAQFAAPFGREFEELVKDEPVIEAASGTTVEPVGPKRAAAIARIVIALLKEHAKRKLRLSRHSAPKLAELLRMTLSELKGPMMKVGQILGQVAHLMPPEIHEALQGLQYTSHKLRLGAARKIVIKELGAAFYERFASFEDEPFANASVGQVHRATLRDGRKVAVKVQYPYIERIIRSDLRLFRVLRQIAGMFFPQLRDGALLDEIGQLLLLECDYTREAKMLALVGGAFAGDAEIIVPAVHSELSTARVLVMDFIEGERFDLFVRRSSQEERNRVGRIIFRSVYESLLTHGFLNPDVHPGNFLICGDRVALVDFGAVIETVPSGQRFARTMHIAYVDRDEDAAMFSWQTYCEDSGILPRAGFDLRAHARVLLQTFGRAITEPQPFRFTVESQVALTRMMFVENPNRETLAIPPRLAHSFCLTLGLYGLMTVLGADGDWRLIVREALAKAAQKRTAG